jgi:TonB family protein
MKDLLLYLLKVSAGATMMYAGYLLFFRRDTFYLRNRIFLLLTLIIPTMLPVIRIPVITEAVVSAEPVGAIGNMTNSGTGIQTAFNDVVQNSFDIYLFSGWIYFTVAALLVIRVFISLWSTYTIIKKGNLKNNNFPKVILSHDNLPPFSFFPFAVIPAEEFQKGNYDDILEHEFAHIRQLHTFDLLISELFVAFQWFNPFVWFIKRSIVLNHEYLADKVSLTSKSSAKEYQYRLLNLQPALKHTLLAHSFDSLIKNRIIMINKTPSSKLAIVKNLLIFPVVAIALYAFASPEYKSATIPGSESSKEKITVNPAIQKAERGSVLYQDEFRRRNPEDFPTFRGEKYPGFINWVIENVKYPADAKSKGIQGRVFVSFTVEPDGSVSKISVTGAPDQALAEAVSSVVKSSPSWEPAKNPKFKEPFRTSVTVKFVLPDKVLPDEVFVLVEKMPEYPGGQPALMIFIRDNIKYPPEAAKANIQGTVTVKYVINTEGKVEDVTVVRGVDPSLDKEAIRVIKSLPDWNPGSQAGVPRNVLYALPVKFSLGPETDQQKTQLSKSTEKAIEAFVLVEKMPEYPGGQPALMKFIRDNIKYPPEAAKANLQGTVMVKYVINTEGKVEDVTVVRGVDPSLDREAIRVIKSLPDWTPGSQAGVPRNVLYSSPVKFSLGPETDQQKPQLSKSTEKAIMGFLMDNISYPQSAKDACDTGKVFLTLKLTKGGVIKEFKAFTYQEDFKGAVIPEVVITGYKPVNQQNTALPKSFELNDHPALKAECLKVANKLTVKEIPEWEENNLEFTLAFKFNLI